MEMPMTYLEKIQAYNAYVKRKERRKKIYTIIRLIEVLMLLSMPLWLK